MPLPQIEKMPLNKIMICDEQKRHLSLYFADIAKRQCSTGNLHDMMLEAYILGFYECMKVTGKMDESEAGVSGKEGV